MIYVRVGKPGEGKSLTASMDIKDLLDGGFNVYTNLHLNERRPNYHYFDTEDYEVIFDLQDGWIYFDEGQVLLDARQWEKLPVAFKYLLQKGRHEGLDFVILTQNINQIDVLARRLVHEGDFVWRVCSWKRFNFGIFLIFKLDLTKIEEQHYGGWPDLRIATKSDWEYYNSFALRTNKDPRVDIRCECGIVHQISRKSPRKSETIHLEVTEVREALTTVKPYDEDFMNRLSTVDEV